VTFLTQFAGRVVKRQQIELLMVAMLCQSHVLIEDVPGTWKTMLARSNAASMGIEFKRLQCTPDLLPNDITRVGVFNQKAQASEFRPGRHFCQLLAYVFEGNDVGRKKLGGWEP
jgi:MoxR-like ATPase